jgi:uracil-DNA glycosylase
VVNERLELVYQAVHDDPYWNELRQPGIHLVPGYGQADPRLCKVLLVGEAPGATENARLRPFCGPSGRILNLLTAEAGLRLDDEQPRYGGGPVGSGKPGDDIDPNRRANAFVTNVVKYRPPGNRTPTYAETQHAKQTLRREWLALGGPRAIVCVGGVAHSAMHPEASVLNISTAAGQGWWPLNDGKTILFSQYHPAYGLRRGEGTQRMMTQHWRTMGEMLRAEGIL